MATKNSFYGQLVFSIAISFLLAACSPRSKRTEDNQISAPAAPASTIESENKHASPPRANDAPKIGLILGPGGLKAFAHIGVLRELEKARIPIHSVVGLEWGALVGGLYALKGKSNDVEWKMLKLKKEELPATTLFKSAPEAKDIGVLDGFLSDVFEGKSFSNMDISFTCPAMTIDGDRRVWAKNGALKDAMIMCLPFPPIYKPARNFLASATEVREAAKKLREGGAEVIVLVNVLAQGSVLKPRKSAADYDTQVLWNSIKQVTAQDESSVDFVIGVHTREYDILNFDARRSMILFGSQSGTIAAKKLIDKYGL